MTIRNHTTDEQIQMPVTNPSTQFLFQKDKDEACIYKSYLW
jgi:hypothetical protein